MLAIITFISENNIVLPKGILFYEIIKVIIIRYGVVLLSRYKTPYECATSYNAMRGIPIANACTAHRYYSICTIKMKTRFGTKKICEKTRIYNMKLYDSVRASKVFILYAYAYNSVLCKCLAIFAFQKEKGKCEVETGNQLIFSFPDEKGKKIGLLLGSFGFMISDKESAVCTCFRSLIWSGGF